MARDQGVDWAVFQGNTGKLGYKNDKFAISQIGGINANGIYEQDTYIHQVANAKEYGLRAHTYIWYEVGGSKTVAKQVLDHFLPKIKTPKGSIVALDYENGASGNEKANTDAILYGMDRITKAGYTPMYYSYKPYTLDNVDYKKIIAKYPNSLWIASYPTDVVTNKPFYAAFPSMDGVAIWQFTRFYRAGGLDGNVDLTGITQNGYGKKVTPKPKKAEYFTWNPVKIITKNKVLAYSKANQVGSGKNVQATYKKGTELKVAKVEGHRFKLDNGLYITANKDYVKNLYYVSKDLKQVKLIHKAYLYKDVNAKEKLRAYPKGEVFDIVDVVKTKSGIWRLKTKSGFYLTANKNYVVKTK